MIKHIINFLSFRKFRLHNFNKLKKIDLNKKVNKKIILLEFNSFHIVHINFSYFSFFFLKKNFKIIAFYSHILMAYGLKETFKQKIFRFLSSLLNLGFFGVYKSFGVKKFLFPKIDIFVINKAKFELDKIQKKIKSKKDILKITLSNIYVGDLVYDTYLTRAKNQKPTIDYKSNDFKNFLFDFIKLFYFWDEYFKKNKIKAIISTHGCYTMGIPLRISLKNKILSLEVKENKLKRLSNENLFHYCESKYYPKMFSALKNNQKKKAINIAKKRLDERFGGSNKDLPYVTNSAFSKKKRYKNEIKKNKKLKILILPHDFIDAPHSGGLFAFPDMYEWIRFLAKMSKEKLNYDWYLKTHPKMGGKWEWYQKLTRDYISKIIKDSNIKVLHPNTPHNKIISSKIDFVLTIFGTAAHEYAYKNIKVINGGNTNPHISYKFNKHISNYKDYFEVINNLKKVNFKIDKKKVLEFYYIHYIYCDKNWFFDYDKLLKNLGNYHLQWTPKVYEYWLSKVNDHKNYFKVFEKNINSFIASKDLVFTIDHKKQDGYN